MAKIAELNEVSWRQWVNSRPEVVKDLCERFPPDRLYLLKSSNHRVTILSYGEDGTMRVAVTGQYNVVMFEREVFGIPPEELEECDLPPESEVLGAVLTEPDEIDGFIDDKIAERHERGEKHNESRCRLCLPSAETQST